MVDEVRRGEESARVQYICAFPSRASSYEWGGVVEEGGDGFVFCTPCVITAVPHVIIHSLATTTTPTPVTTISSSSPRAGR